MASSLVFKFSILVVYFGEHRAYSDNIVGADFSFGNPHVVDKSSVSGIVVGYVKQSAFTTKCGMVGRYRPVFDYYIVCFFSADCDNHFAQLENHFFVAVLHKKPRNYFSRTDKVFFYVEFFKTFQNALRLFAVGCEFAFQGFVFLLNFADVRLRRGVNPSYDFVAGFVIQDRRRENQNQGYHNRGSYRIRSPNNVLFGVGVFAESLQRAVFDYKTVARELRLELLNCYSEEEVNKIMHENAEKYLSKIYKIDKNSYPIFKIKNFQILNEEEEDFGIKIRRTSLNVEIEGNVENFSGMFNSFLIIVLLEVNNQNITNYMDCETGEPKKLDDNFNLECQIYENAKVDNYYLLPYYAIISAEKPFEVVLKDIIKGKFNNNKNNDNADNS